MSQIPPPPPYNPSNLITGSRTNVSDRFVFQNAADQEYIGFYYTIVKSGGNEYYTGESPSKPNNEKVSTVRSISTGNIIPGGCTSNLRILTFSERGLSTPGQLLEPTPHNFLNDLLPENFQNNQAARFFAYNKTTNIFRETDYISYDKISKKDPNWDFTNWEVKTVYNGWKINFFNLKLFEEIEFSKGISTIQYYPQASNYLANKLAMLAIQFGYKFPPPTTPAPKSPVGGIIIPDPNSTNPWPGFVNWYYRENDEAPLSYFFTMQRPDGSYIDNSLISSPSLSATPSPQSTPTTSLKITFTFYSGNDPKIPLNVRFYTYNKFQENDNIIPNLANVFLNTNNRNTRNSPFKDSTTGRGDGNSFLKGNAPVWQDVSIAPSGNLLKTSKLTSWNKNFFLDENNEIFQGTSNLSEIFLNNPRYKGNPNAKALADQNKLYIQDASGNLVPYKGPFCKNVQGKYYSSNLPLATLYTQGYQSSKELVYIP